MRANTKRQSTNLSQQRKTTNPVQNKVLTTNTLTQTLHMHANAFVHHTGRQAVYKKQTEGDTDMHTHIWNKTAFQLKTDHPPVEYTDVLFWHDDLDIQTDPRYIGLCVCVCCNCGIFWRAMSVSISQPWHGTFVDFNNKPNKYIPRCTCIPKMNVSGHGIRSLESKQDTETRFCSCELYLDQMILIYESPDLDTLKMYMHTKKWTL